MTTTPGDGQPITLTDAIIEAAVDNAIDQAKLHDTAPAAVIGATPPVPQPGIPPMSQRTTEITRAVMYCSLATVPPGLVATAILVASEHADPTIIGMICAAPAVIAVPILAVAKLLRGAKPEPDVHHHYEGPVYQDQRNVHTKNTGVWAKTTNQQ